MNDENVVKTCDCECEDDLNDRNCDGDVTVIPQNELRWVNEDGEELKELKVDLKY